MTASLDLPDEDSMWLNLTRMDKLDQLSNTQGSGEEQDNVTTLRTTPGPHFWLRTSLASQLHLLPHGHQRHLRSLVQAPSRRKLPMARNPARPGPQSSDLALWEEEHLGEIHGR